MLLAVDIGNTNITIGVFEDVEGGALKAHFRVNTDKKKTSDEYGSLMAGLFSASGLKAAPGGAIICSVVPSIDAAFNEALARYFSLRPIVVGTEGVKTGMPVLTDNPLEVGADRIVNAVAAFSIHKCALIVVDFGTAVTFDYVTGKGEYAGGVIAPGINISAEALFEKTAKLPRIEVRKPDRVIGKNTVESMTSGVYWGFVGLVDGIIARMKYEAGPGARVIATGGLAPLVAGTSRFVKEYDEFLTLKGLKIIYEGNRNG